MADLPNWNPEGFWRSRRSKKHTKVCRAHYAKRGKQPPAIDDCMCPPTVLVGRRRAKVWRQQKLTGIKRTAQGWIGSGARPQGDSRG